MRMLFLSRIWELRNNSDRGRRIKNGMESELWIFLIFFLMQFLKPNYGVPILI